MQVLKGTCTDNTVINLSTDLVRHFSNSNLLLNKITRVHLICTSLLFNYDQGLNELQILWFEPWDYVSPTAFSVIFALVSVKKSYRIFFLNVSWVRYLFHSLYSSNTYTHPAIHLCLECLPTLVCATSIITIGYRPPDTYSSNQVCTVISSCSSRGVICVLCNLQ